MKDLNEIVDKEVEDLKSRDDVRAVALVGSYARNPDQEHNDIDFFIIVEADWRKRKTEKQGGHVLEKFFNSMEWAKSYFDDDKDRFYMYEWMENADVRYDPESLFEELENLVEKEKQGWLNQEIDEEKILYNIWDRKQDLETDDVGQKRYMMYRMFDYLLEQAYRLNDETPVKENYRVKHLQDFDGYMYKLAQEFLTSSSTLEKERKLEKMVEHVTRGMGEPSPEWETDKEEF